MDSGGTLPSRNAAALLVAVLVGLAAPSVVASPSVTPVDALERRWLAPGARPWLTNLILPSSSQSSQVLSVRRERAVSTSGGSDGTWSRLVPGVSFPGLYATVCLRDSIRDRWVVIGGGSDKGLTNDVWVLGVEQGAEWARLAVAGLPPPPRYRHTAIYDSRRDRILVFGGYGIEAGTLQVFSDCWELALSETARWSRIDPSGPAPPARYDHAAVLDSENDRMLIVAGASDSTEFVPRNDVWALDLRDPPVWRQLQPDGASPSPRMGHAAAYDRAGKRLLLFGGFDGVFRNDLWALDLDAASTWSELAPEGVLPAERAWMASAFDPRDGKWFFQGGRGPRSPARDTWILDVRGDPAWQDATPATGAPPNRAYAAAGWDEQRLEMLCVGGAANEVFDDAWLFSMPTHSWIRLGPPERRSGHSAVYDPVRNRMLVFGGSRDTHVWSLDLSSGTPYWSMLQIAGTPPPSRDEHVAVFDATRSRMLVHGGAGLERSELLGDLWALELEPAPRWVELEPMGVSPAVRYHHAAIVDPTRDRMLLFGGKDNRDWMNDVWELALAGTTTWTQLPLVASAPPELAARSATFDPVRDRTLILGGNTDELLEFGTGPFYRWVELPAGGSRPLVRWEHGAAYDEARDRLLLSDYGGAFALQFEPALAWRALTPAGPAPPPRTNHTVVYDSRSDRLILYGGRIGSAGFDTATWALQFDPTSNLESSDIPPRDSIGSEKASEHRIALQGVAGGADPRAVDQISGGSRRDAADHAPATELTSSGSQEDVYWSDGFGGYHGGVDGEVTALFAFENQVVFVGNFLNAGGWPTHGIALWRDQSWTWLEPTPWSNFDAVRAVTVWDGKLIASAGGSVYVRDADAWRQLGTRLDTHISALAIVGGMLVAGGGDSRPIVPGRGGGGGKGSVWRWDGVLWHRLGESLNGEVRALAVYRDTLLVGGRFDAAGTEPLHYIAAWDGTGWITFHGGANSFVETLFVDGNGLYLGGRFTHSGRPDDPIPAARITVWDGSAWHNVGAGFDHADRRLATVFALAGDGGGGIVAGGDFDRAGSAASPYLARWDGTEWAPLAKDAPDGPVRTVHRRAGQHIVGGSFQKIGSLPLRGAALWDGSNWQPLSTGRGLDDRVTELIEYRGDLIAGGLFARAGPDGREIRGLARWDENEWRAFADDRFNTVTAMTVHADRLVVAGSCIVAGAIEGCLGTWDGTAWLPLPVPEWGVRELGVYDGDLIAVGLAREGGNASRASAWDGSTWRPLGASIPGPQSGFNTLTVWDGKLVAAGVGAIVAWDGSDWTAVGEPPNAAVFALAVHAGQLVAGGGFTRIDGVPMHGLARWDGASWQWFGAIGGTVNALLDTPHGFYAGALVQSNPPIGVARFDGTGWKTLGSGVFSGSVDALGSRGSELWVGGGFSVVGTKPCTRIARWTGGALPNPALELSQDPDAIHEIAVSIRFSTPPLPESVLLEVGGQPVPVVPIDARGRVWRGDVRLSPPGGVVALRACARSPYSDLGCTALAFNAAYIPATRGGSVTSPNSRFRASLPPGALARDGFFLVYETERSESQFTLLAAYALGPGAQWGGEAVHLEFAFEPGELQGRSAARLVVLGPDGGIVPARVDSERSVVSCSVTRFGKYALALGSEAVTPAADVRALTLDQNAPNPFNPSTRIRFEVQTRQQVRVAIYDVAGRRVAVLLDSEVAPGRHSVAWNGRSTSGRQVASGIYFYEVRTSYAQATRRMQLVR